MNMKKKRHLGQLLTEFFRNSKTTGTAVIARHLFAPEARQSARSKAFLLLSTCLPA